eukprot:scaffold36346_cov39-Prasinocladus_malaysianus.AAC.1
MQGQLCNKHSSSLAQRAGQQPSMVKASPDVVVHISKTHNATIKGRRTVANLGMRCGKENRHIMQMPTYAKLLSAGSAAWLTWGGLPLVDM